MTASIKGRPRKPAAKRTPRASRLLAVDVGNTSVAIGVFDGDELLAQWRIGSAGERTGDEIVHLLRGLASDRGIALAPPMAGALTSVVPTLTREFASALAEITGAPPLVLDHRTDLGIPNRYQDPAAVGPDRLANAIAASELYGLPAIVVDLGTATTFDVVSARGEYLGGAIAPGIATSADVLFRRAARLPRVELSAPERTIGRTTEESIRAGIILGHAILIDGLVARIRAELGAKPRVIATGGYADLVRGACTSIEIVDPALTLKGLQIAHRRLERRRASATGRSRG